jgi:hypothetical protein
MVQNLKQFLLHKGERLGMGIALLTMLVLIGLGAWSGFISASPRDTANEIKSKAQKIQDAIQHGAAESDPDLPALILNNLDGQPVDASAFATPTPVFIDTSIENPRRVAPTVLAPDEFEGQVALVQAMNYYVLPGEKPRVGVLLSKDQEKKKAEIPANVARFMAARQLGMPVDPRLTILLQQQAKVAELLAKNNPPAGAAFVNQPEWKLEFVDVDKVPAGARLATTVQPYRMAMVSASFPYRRQLYEYCRALRLPGIRALHDSQDGLMPRFSKIVVRRRAIDEHGKLAEDWTPLAVETDILPALGRAVRFGPLEAGEEALRPLVYSGLVISRPGLARGAYPRPNLKLLDKALQELRAQTAENNAVLVAAPLERRLRGADLSPFGDGAALEEQGKQPVRPNSGAKDAAPGEKELIVPEYCLVRFCDINVRPGWTYEYQLKLRVENPNFGNPASSVAYPDLAKTRELEADAWAPREPVKVAVAADTCYYATELDDKVLTEMIRRDARVKEFAFVEMHRWLENVRFDDTPTPYPVGNWTVAEVAVRRGGFVRGSETVKLPVWLPTRECFDFPATKSKGIRVGFSTTDLVVDWEGGRIQQTFNLTAKTNKEVQEDAGLEILVLSADGTLRVHNSRAERSDPQRKQRRDDYKKFIDEVENNRKKGAER